ncbi:MAG: biotin--[acetyl-CoA-carboxylase] ligase [Candidatus Zixiibacteriota bacterium]|nr:MAG: biotin--[acetyl-CoA-carboxylase] ligase [candidate division Zixibacteria bacterium]
MKTGLSFESHRIQAEILHAALNSDNRKILFSDLEKKTGYTMEIIKENMKELAESRLGSVGRKYFRVPELPDLILPPVILIGLRSGYMGRRIFAYKSIGSTNDTAKRLAESDSPEGTLVIAEKQTKGRGRLGRSWHSPQNKGLYFSLVLRPQIPVEKMPALSLVAALSVCRVIESMTDLKPQIKWPNDCLIDGKKVAGILIDISAELGRVSYAILGVGLNINTAQKDFSSGLRKSATSLAIQTGKMFSRVDCLRPFLHEFEKSYRNFYRYGLEFIASEIIKRSSVIGREINFKLSGKKYTAMALGYDENGGLMVKSKSGVKVLSGGEITIRK